MKTLLSLILLVSINAHAQSSFFNYKVTSFPQFSPGVFKGVTNVVVGTNTIAKFVGIQTAGGVNNVDIIINNPGLPAVAANWTTDDVLNTRMLGPCTVTVTATSSTSANTLALFLVQFETVNTSPTPGQMVIQPSGFDAVVTLEASTNLTTWQTITNASFPKMSGNRFFRTSITVP
tara:strand:- start:602 stop:1129 length:528 start_codon:yes stop_codon:yes gene_type:complete